MALAGCAEAESTPTAAESLENLFTTIDLMDATISGLQTEMEEGHVTSEQLTQMYIDRIEAYDEELQLNSIIMINPGALDDARQLDLERSEGNVRGPLHGIPIVVKANYEVAGLPTSAGANVLANMIATEDAFVIKKLKDAGAVILAQANLSEFANSSTNSRSTLGGVSRNAYDTDKTPGGSSGGTAVAVTSNFAAAGLGTDTGGSIRNPSSFSNVYGIRPSKGLTSITGVFPLAAYRDTTGPIARTAEDLALLLEIMAGTDEKDDYTLEADADSLLGDGYTESLSEDGLKGMRIGYLGFSFMYYNDKEFTVPDDRIDDMVNKTLANLRKAGAEFVNLEDYLPQETLTAFDEELVAETFEYDVNKYLSEKGDAAPYKTIKELVESGTGTVMHMNLRMMLNFRDDLAASLEETENPYSETVGSYQRIPVWQDILDARTMVSKVMEENDIDAIMYMNHFDVEPKEEVFTMTEKHNNANFDMIFATKLGFPEISIPMGFSNPDSDYETPLPLGLSVFADFGQEETLLKLAYAYEQQAGGYIRRMPEQMPALEDESLKAFLEDLIDKAYTIDYGYKKKPEGKIQLMLGACEKAKAVDTKDPYATYEAARELAEAYDNVMAEIKG